MLGVGLDDQLIYSGNSGKFKLEISFPKCSMEHGLGLRSSFADLIE